MARAIQIADPVERFEAIDAALDQLPRPTRLRGEVVCARASLYAALFRYVEARAGAEECSRLLPGDPRVDEMMAGILLGRALAGLGAPDDLQRGATLLASTYERAPERALSAEPLSALSLLRRLGYARLDKVRDRYATALIAAGFPAAHPGLLDPFIGDLMLSRIASGDKPGAVRLLPLLTDLQTALGIIVDRRFEPVWPDIDRWSGGDLLTQRRAGLASTRAQFERDDNLATRSYWGLSLARSGQVKAALDIFDAGYNSPAWRDEAQGRAGYVTRHATALSGDGRLSEATDVQARALALMPLTKIKSAADLATQYAFNLARIGRGSEAIAELDRIEAAAAAKQVLLEGRGATLWFDAIRACALGPAAGALYETVLARLRHDAPVNPTTLRESLACQGEVGPLSDNISAALKAPVYERGLVLALRSVGFKPGSTPYARAWRAVAADPTVVLQLDRISRPIPIAYWAVAGDRPDK